MMKANLNNIQHSQSKFNGYNDFSIDMEHAFSTLCSKYSFQIEILSGQFYNERNNIIFKSSKLGIYFIVNSSDIDWLLIEAYFFDLKSEEVLNVTKFLQKRGFDSESWEKSIMKATFKKRLPKCIQIQIPFWVKVFENELKDVLSLDFQEIVTLYEQNTNV